MMKATTHRASRLAALHELMVGIHDRTQQGQRVPCVDPTIGHWWTSEDRERQRDAVDACSRCPALAACTRYVEEFPEPTAVWAARPPMVGSTRGGVMSRPEWTARIAASNPQEFVAFTSNVAASTEVRVRVRNLPRSFPRCDRCGRGYCVHVHAALREHRKSNPITEETPA